MHRLLAFAQLMRVPNVFTAMADIVLGAWAVGAIADSPATFACLLLASSFAYLGGMVWNDWFDVKIDLRERPGRPLPSGRITLSTALWLGVGLFAGAILFGLLPEYALGRTGSRSMLILGILLATILLYDGWLKRTVIGPFAMGTCRFLNVALGLSAAATPIPPWGWCLALAVGLYIVGVTWFAKQEADVSDRGMLQVGAGIMACGLILGLAVPSLAEDMGARTMTWIGFPFALALFGAYLAIAVIAAIRRPAPEKVQAAVKRSVLGLTLLDATLATALVGVWGLAIGLLLLPARLLGRWVYST
jgi:4-hydroxybenzoate polyprenyltransferase